MDDISLLAQTGGVFTTGGAAQLGIGRERLSLAVRRRLVRRLARGLFAVGPAPHSPELRHLELCRALLLEYPDAVLAGRSAVVALGLPTWRVPLDTALLHRPVVSQVSRSGAVIRPGAGDPQGPRTATGPVTPVAHALVQLAFDHGAAAGVVSADAALHAGSVAVVELEAEVARRAGHRRSQQGVAMTRLVDARSESPGESRLRVTLGVGAIDLEPQYVVRDGAGGVVARADFRVAGTRVLIEFDGLVKYRDGGVEALVREKRREDRLRALGWIVLRFTWADLERPDLVIDTVRRAIAADARMAARAG